MDAVRQAYRAERTNVTFRRFYEKEATPYWVVRGGELRGFGKIPVYAGNEAEAREVAKALNRVNGL